MVINHQFNTLFFNTRPFLCFFKMVYWLLFSALAVCSLPSICTASPIDETLTLKKAASAANIDRFIYYYADTQGNQTLNDILINPNIFVPSTEKRFIFNVHTHWYQIKLTNPYDSPKEWFISTSVTSPPYLKAYWINSKNNDIRVISNSRIPTSKKEKKVHFTGYTIPLRLEPEEQGTLIIEYQSMANFQLRIKAYTEHAIMSRSLQIMLLNGIYIGIISVFFLFFLAQFIFRPTRTLGYYTLFIFSLIAFVGQINGYGIQTLWPSLKQFNNLIFSFLGGSIYIWYFLFTARIFQLQEHNRQLYYVMIGLCIGISSFVILGVFIPMDYALSVLIVLGLPWPSIIAIWAVRQKHPSAKIFLLGSCIHCTTTYMFMLTCLGINMGDNSLVYGLATAGQLIDIICFSIAIFYQHNQIREQYHHQVELRLSDMHCLNESEQLSAKMISQSKENVLQTAATIHDLVQPLSAIKMMLASQDENLKVTKNMKNALNYADNLLHTVLKSSKVDYQNIQKNVNIQHLLQNIHDRHRAGFTNKHIQLSLFCPDMEISCLPIIINRVVDNLLANALRYTSSGKVLLSGRRRANNRFLIQIWDTGQGIPHQKINKILSPFEQLNSEDIEKLGFGLGLFIVKSLCDEAGYELKIRSQVGKGTCFSILLTDTNI